MLGPSQTKSAQVDAGRERRLWQHICVLGLGYVGLPTAAVLASKGCHVTGVDVDSKRVAIINGGGTPITEPDLSSMVQDAVASGRLKAQTEVAPADAFIIAVPTPLKGDQEPDLRHLRAAATEVARVLVPNNLVVLESTSPVGTTEAFCDWLAVARPDLSFPHRVGAASDIRVAYSPERVLPGAIVGELVENDRIIGGITPECGEAARSLYQQFVHGECSVTKATTAELVKLTENAHRDVNIAFANEISLVCDEHGVDPWELIELANRHPRVSVLQPGPGVGGHCIAVDPWFLVHSAPGLTHVIQTARQVNDRRPAWVVDQVLAACHGIARPDIACLGLAYKADVGDLRESPAIEIVKKLCTRMAGRVFVVEPHIEDLPVQLAGERIELVDLDEALEAATITVLLTDHREFLEIDPDRLRGKRVVDTRGAWRGF
ncbi:MAG: UDP-N-acetyl-D-mannosamine dehydrogenase [Gammaproteobacteria bacterium]|nr:UDP-N-acetyl-D-mannosamine dehydrogenase [Gammaproteobacteria bacterium]MDE0441462.1 UDP-N-acetyl-D-mannosamine dehydrogenase [Gammaproteobacteria bacterium]